jgi:hypothetical protein
LNLLYSGGATCYPSPGAPPPSNFHQRTRGVRGSSRLKPPMSRRQTSPASTVHPTRRCIPHPVRPGTFRDAPAPTSRHASHAASSLPYHKPSIVIRRPPNPAPIPSRPLLVPPTDSRPFSNLSRCCFFSVPPPAARSLPVPRSAPGYPKHLRCGGSRKGVPGLERSGEAGTPFLKARRRAKLRERAGSSVFVWVVGL